MKILNDQLLKNIPARPIKPITFNMVISTIFPRGIELTMVFPDKHVETVIVGTDYIDFYSSWDSLEEMFDDLFSGDDILLNNSLKENYPSLWEDLTKHLGQNGVEIINAYYMVL